MALTNPLHLLFIAIIALVFLGPKRLPELAKSLGTGMREFRDTLSGDHHEPQPQVAAPAEVPQVKPEA